MPHAPLLIRRLEGTGERSAFAVLDTRKKREPDFDQLFRTLVRRTRDKPDRSDMRILPRFRLPDDIGDTGDLDRIAGMIPARLRLRSEKDTQCEETKNARSIERRSRLEKTRDRNSDETEKEWKHDPERRNGRSDEDPEEKRDDRGLERPCERKRRRFRCLGVRLPSWELPSHMLVIRDSRSPF